MKQHDLHQKLSEAFPEDQFVTTIDFRGRKFIVKSKLYLSWIYEVEYLPFAEMPVEKLFAAVRKSYLVVVAAAGEEGGFPLW